jgi:transcriptional regulator of acetoin/glycerol metabolism
VKLTISEAARRAGVRRMTIYRKLEAGKLSKETDEDGNPVIDLAELARVYPHAITASDRNPEKPRDTPGTSAETAEVREFRALLEQERQERQRERADKDDVIADLRQQRDRLLALHEADQRLLADLREKPPRQRRWFARLMRA